MTIAYNNLIILFLNIKYDDYIVASTIISGISVASVVGYPQSVKRVSWSAKIRHQ